ncbi:uncharacterized protein B0H18DRAFT_666517 [Fomitopsis serialis]|uniref:uncharacterized protein n=1 Tax=Fomitopsis serialis TaxID=139415 RepID=UPI0020079CC0|nr:uncharacterized protein B0H18DRAFT_666517 [Neoantrodia serialis]KAH9918482.1 hypothetical protein B0H18DRAFT_666517 [Neoantrodia serialis]
MRKHTKFSCRRKNSYAQRAGSESASPSRAYSHRASISVYSEPSIRWYHYIFTSPYRRPCQCAQNPEVTHRSPRRPTQCQRANFPQRTHHPRGRSPGKWRAPGSSLSRLPAPVWRRGVPAVWRCPNSIQHPCSPLPRCGCPRKHLSSLDWTSGRPADTRSAMGTLPSSLTAPASLDIRGLW